VAPDFSHPEDSTIKALFEVRPEFQTNFTTPAGYLDDLARGMMPSCGEP